MFCWLLIDVLVFASEVARHNTNSAPVSIMIEKQSIVGVENLYLFHFVDLVLIIGW